MVALFAELSLPLTLNCTVYEFCDTDLELIIKDSTLVLQRGHVKSYMIQTLRGLEYLHANWILHRDMKVRW